MQQIPCNLNSATQLNQISSFVFTAASQDMWMMMRQNLFPDKPLESIESYDRELWGSNNERQHYSMGGFVLKLFRFCSMTMLSSTTKGLTLVSFSKIIQQEKLEISAHLLSRYLCGAAERKSINFKFVVWYGKLETHENFIISTEIVTRNQNCNPRLFRSAQSSAEHWTLLFLRRNK
jgi:hypothetical protein